MDEKDTSTRLRLLDQSTGDASDLPTHGSSRLGLMDPCKAISR